MLTREEGGYLAGTSQVAGVRLIPDGTRKCSRQTGHSRAGPNPKRKDPDVSLAFEHKVEEYVV